MQLLVDVVVERVDGGGLCGGLMLQPHNPTRADGGQGSRADGLNDVETNDFLQIVVRYVSPFEKKFDFDDSFILDTLA